MRDIKAILFDKDGTLFDFQKSWAGWARGVLAQLSGKDGAREARLAEAIGYDLARGEFLRSSCVIAGTMQDVTQALLPHLPGRDTAELIAELDQLSASAVQVPAAPLAPLLGALRGRGLALGVMTNDSEAAARAHLRGQGVLELFDLVLGADSGHGAKPDAGPLLAFARHVGAAPAQVVMVGDSLHDMAAAHRAGMVALGVLSGPARREDLAPAADLVLPSIADLPAWLAAGAP